MGGVTAGVLMAAAHQVQTPDQFQLLHSAFPSKYYSPPTNKVQGCKPFRQTHPKSELPTPCTLRKQIPHMLAPYPPTPQNARLRTMAL